MSAPTAGTGTAGPDGTGPAGVGGAGTAGTGAARAGAEPSPAGTRTGAARVLIAVWSMAAVELRRYLQDRTALFSLLALPVLVVLLVGSAFGAGPDEYTVAVVDRDGTPESAALVAGLDSAEALRARPYDDERELRRDLRLGEVSAGVLVPEGYSAALGRADAVEISVLTVQADEATAVVLTLVNGALAREGAVAAAAGFASEALDVSPQRATTAAREAAAVGELPAVSLDMVGTVRPEDENAFTRAVLSQLVLFVFINGLIASAALVETRRLGIGRRALASPVGPTTLVAGIGGSRLTLGLLQSVLLLAMGAGVFGVRWGDPVATALLVVLWSAVAAAAGMLLGAVARSADQAVAIAVPTGIALAMLGGTLWPLEVVTPAMRVVGYLTPHAWAMAAWSGIVNESAGVGEVGLQLAVLLGWLVALLLPAGWALRRTLSR